jgi:hypothetical protein
VIFELLAAVKHPDPERTRELRRRYLAIVLDGMRAGAGPPLPGTAPTWQEVASRWTPTTGRAGAHSRSVPGICRYHDRNDGQIVSGR